MDLTQLSQQDEHLRRATTADPVRAGLAHVADHLSTTCGDRNPANEITVHALRSIARGWAVQTYDWDAQADRLFQLLWDAMPEPYDGQTRGEYAARVRLELLGGRTI